MLDTLSPAQINWAQVFTGVRIALKGDGALDSGTSNGISVLEHIVPANGQQNDDAHGQPSTQMLGIKSEDAPAPALAGAPGGAGGAAPAGVVNMDGTVIAVESKAVRQEKMRGDILREVENGLKLSRGNCDRYSLCIRNAGEDFEAYTTPILDELTVLENPEGLLAPLVGVALSILGAHLGEKVNKALGEAATKLLGTAIDKLTDPFRDHVVKGLEDKLKNTKSLEEVRKGVKELVTAGKNGAKAASAAAGKSIETALTDIETYVKSNKPIPEDKPLSDGQSEIIAVFLSTDADSALEGFGVPSGASTMKMEAEIYSAWVKSFHVQLLQRQNKKNAGSDYMEQLSDKEIDRLAQAHADEAKKALEGDVEAANRKKRGQD